MGGTRRRTAHRKYSPRVDVSALLIAFLVIAPAELPDKTFIATLVLATRYRPLGVWLGVTAAFAVQTTIAVLAGQLLTLLPEKLVLTVTAVLFALGALLILRGSGSMDMEEGEAEEEKVVAAASAGHKRAFTVSFLVLLAAEWGDLSQLTTATLTARFDAPLEVWLGSFAALALVAGLATLAGRWLVGHVSFKVVRRVSGGLLAFLALATFLDVIEVIRLPG
jgi:putative Ca2+/H+ antiporter (TMEM165/GDT1 family)